MAKKEIYDLIIIGSGPGGYVAAVRAAQFVQIEHRVNTMIDIMIASELPLIQ